MYILNVFNVALFYFILSGCISSYGLISNLYYTLKKFDLLGYLTDYLHHSEIPDKQIWKEIVRSKIVGLENSLWRARMSNEADFDRFSSIHEYLRPASVWQLAKTRQHAKVFTYVAKLWAAVPQIQLDMCIRCGSVYTDLILHCCVSCPYMSNFRNSFWDFLTDQFPLSLHILLFNAEDELQLQYLLGKRLPSGIIDKETSKLFALYAACFVVQCAAIFCK